MSRARDLLSAEDWRLLRRQLDGLRLFWRVRRARPEAERPAVCGAFWISDAGPLPCTRALGHDGAHLAYGASGALTWSPLAPGEATAE